MNKKDKIFITVYVFLALINIYWCYLYWIKNLMYLLYFTLLAGVGFPIFGILFVIITNKYKKTDNLE